MKWLLVCAALLAVIGTTSDGFAQSRNPQFEVFGGAAFPLKPDTFKDYYKIGFSGHAQYVLFPSPTVGVTVGAAFEGFTFDGNKFLTNLGTQLGQDLTGYNASGNARILEFGVGIRPYLTPATASTQFFLFGMGTVNRLHDELKATAPDGSEIFNGKNDVTKFGVAGGAGIEIPAGSSMNIIVQGLARIIFTDQENTSFVGVTGGLVF
jgi:hypothetical protein